MPTGFQLEWVRMREYPLYEVSSNGRFRLVCSRAEVPRDALGVAQLLTRLSVGADVRDQVCGWAMADQYFYTNNTTKAIAENSCLAGNL